MATFSDIIDFLLALLTDEEAQGNVAAMREMDILQSEDIANAIAYVVTQPERVSINEVLIRPTQQAN